MNKYESFVQSKLKHISPAQLRNIIRLCNKVLAKKQLQGVE